MENELNEPVPKYSFVSAEVYLERERSVPEKHEYYQGEIFAMSGSSLQHVIISRNIMVALANKLKGKSCQPYGNDLRIHIPSNTLYTYPDLTVICGDPVMTDDRFDTAINPTILIEILSPSTRNYDMGIKFRLYRGIETLQEYILIDSEAVYVERHRRQDNNSWLLTELTGGAAVMKLDAIATSISLHEIYEGTSL